MLNLVQFWTGLGEASVILTPGSVTSVTVTWQFIKRHFAKGSGHAQAQRPIPDNGPCLTASVPLSVAPTCDVEEQIQCRGRKEKKNCVIMGVSLIQAVPDPQACSFQPADKAHF